MCGMQGKLIFGAILLVGLTPAAMAAEQTKRPACDKSYHNPQSRDRPQQGQPQRDKTTECRTPRNIPPVVDPTPWFLL